MLSAQLDAVASRLDLAARTQTPCALVADELGGDLHHAYQVQDLWVHRQLAAGRRLAGVKAALTNAAAQKAMKAEAPAWGTLFTDMILADGEPVSPSRLMAPRAEGEAALILERDLDRPDLSILDLLRAVAYVVPAIEIPCRRYSAVPGVVDMVADNSSAGLVVLGGPLRRLDGLDLATIHHRLTCNGAVVAEGTGRDCLGHPLHAAVWVARQAALAGRPLRAGQLIMTGSLGTPQPVRPGDHLLSRIEGLGEVDVQILAA